ncbi:hypothetical protein GCM10025872_29750 [Barrientosiimonas endolithica]|uniref:Uncharacterized protein n=1 Tax=Barrientosiimonas endolithica TaxID=1535208 RepID=A0ABN6YVQ4_9MICO|nr:hypothetical protein GCM10025872_29750 [Barrientosiimonas endolithica]
MDAGEPDESEHDASKHVTVVRQYVWSVPKDGPKGAYMVRGEAASVLLTLRRTYDTR